MTPEFGSDFHSPSREFFTGCASVRNVFPEALLMADGRQGLVAIVRQEGYRRLWVPEYFCYEVLESVRRRTGVELVPYEDFPGMEEPARRLRTRDGDAVLRMNFFGLREKEWMEEPGVPVIEDHSHDVLSRWALYSKADWCVASLRKSLPVAEGGMVWSPKGRRLVVPEGVTEENAALADTRWRAMDLKAEFLRGCAVDKAAFRELFVGTEEGLDGLETSALDVRSVEVMDGLDINKWYRAKRRNWQVLAEQLSGVVDFLIPEDESCTPFSMVLMFKDEIMRDAARRAMIADGVYPAILWKVSQECSERVRKMSGRLLSVHCDGRYRVEDMAILGKKITRIIEEL